MSAACTLCFPLAGELGRCHVGAWKHAWLWQLLIIDLKLPPVVTDLKLVAIQVC